MSESKGRDRRHGSRRAAAWIYEVINPVVEALAIEVSLLEHGDVTWRFLERRPEYIRHIEDYLSPSGAIILEDFTHETRGVGRLFEEHDTLVDELGVVASAACDALLADETFLERVRVTLDEYAEQNDRPAYPGGAFPREAFPSLVADHIVNNVREIARHHTDSRYWDRFGEEFLRFRNGAAFERLHSAREALLEADRNLLGWLKNRRRKLSIQFDVPPAPVPSLAFERG